MYNRPPMQQPAQGQPQTQLDYASLGMRFTAVVIDSLLVYMAAATVWAAVLLLRQPVDPQDTAAMQKLIEEVQASSGTFYLVFFACLFIYYLLLEATAGATVGKLLLGMRVVMADGARASGGAVVLRNLVRIPEALLLYVPAAVSCLSSTRRQRLGDRAARTVVVRRRSARAPVPYGAPGQQQPFPQTPAAPQGAPVPPPPAAPAAAWHQPGDPAAPEPPAVDEALARLKTAALAARGAHLSYLRFSERELAGGGEEQAGGYSEGYVSAWFTLTDAVATLKDAQSAFQRAAAAAGQSPQEAAAAQPDLAHLLVELAPYFETTDDDSVHAAFLAVARAESPSP